VFHKVDGVGAADAGAFETLGKAADFVGTPLEPNGSIESFEKLAVVERAAGDGVDHTVGDGSVLEGTVDCWRLSALEARVVQVRCSAVWRHVLTGVWVLRGLLLSGLGVLVAGGFVLCFSWRRHWWGFTVAWLYVAVCLGLLARPGTLGDASGLWAMLATDWKSSARSWRALSLLESMAAKGMAGAGCFKAEMSSLTASVAASVEEVAGMCTWCGNHLRVSVVRLAPVSIM
jgi:hypothetical protein